MIQTIIESIDMILTTGDAKTIVCNLGIIILKGDVNVRTILSQYTITINGSIIIKTAQKQTIDTFKDFRIQ